MQNIAECDECRRLWRQYSVATSEHIRLDNQLTIAALAHYEEDVTRIAPEVEKAVVRRSEARDAIKVHERAAHSSADAATA
jgi:hypothetical protein